MTQQPTQPRDVRPRILLITSGVLGLIALICGLIQHSDSAGESCGSALIPRSVTNARVQACEWAVQGGTNWMWLSIGLAALGVLCALLTALLAATSAASRR